MSKITIDVVKAWTEYAKDSVSCRISCTVLYDLGDFAIEQNKSLTEARAELAKFKSDELRAYELLSFCGVPKERAGSVSNGIQVYNTRVDKRIAELEAENKRLKEVLRACSIHPNALFNVAVCSRNEPTIKAFIDAALQEQDDQREEAPGSTQA